MRTVPVPQVSDDRDAYSAHVGGRKVGAGGGGGSGGRGADEDGAGPSGELTTGITGMHAPPIMWALA